MGIYRFLLRMPEELRRRLDDAASASGRMPSVGDFASKLPSRRFNNLFVQAAAGRRRGVVETPAKLLRHAKEKNR